MANRILCSLLFIGAAAAAASSPVVLDVDFAAFLARADPGWTYNSTVDMPNDWTQSLFGPCAAGPDLIHPAQLPLT